MKIQITHDFNDAEVYAFCVPKSRRRCSKAIRRSVAFTLDRRINEDGWIYPLAEELAKDLIDQGLADPI